MKYIIDLNEKPSMSLLKRLTSNCDMYRNYNSAACDMLKILYMAQCHNSTHTIDLGLFRINFLEPLTFSRILPTRPSTDTCNESGTEL